MASTRNLGANQHRVFNDRERAILEAFKAKYLDAPSAEARKEVARWDIFPEIFNHWKGLGMVFTIAQENKKKAVCRILFNSKCRLTQTLGINLLDAQHMAETKNDHRHRETIQTYRCTLVDKPGKSHERSRCINGRRLR